MDVQQTIDLLQRLVTKWQQVVDDAKIQLELLQAGIEWKVKHKTYDKEKQEFESIVNATEWYPSNLLKQFKDYWLEKDKKGKPRFLWEKYFDISRRISNRAARAWVKKETKEVPKIVVKDERTQEEKEKIKEQLLKARSFIHKI